MGRLTPTPHQVMHHGAERWVVPPLCGENGAVSILSVISANPVDGAGSAQAARVRLRVGGVVLTFGCVFSEVFERYAGY